MSVKSQERNKNVSTEVIVGPEPDLEIKKLINHEILNLPIGSRYLFNETTDKVHEKDSDCGHNSGKSEIILNIESESQEVRFNKVSNSSSYLQQSGISTPTSTDSIDNILGINNDDLVPIIANGNCLFRSL